MNENAQFEDLPTYWQEVTDPDEYARLYGLAERQVRKLRAENKALRRDRNACREQTARLATALADRVLDGAPQ